MVLERKVKILTIPSTKFLHIVQKYIIVLWSNGTISKNKKLIIGKDLSLKKYDKILRDRKCNKNVSPNCVRKNSLENKNLLKIGERQSW